MDLLHKQKKEEGPSNNKKAAEGKRDTYQADLWKTGGGLEEIPRKFPEGSGERDLSSSELQSEMSKHSNIASENFTDLSKGGSVDIKPLNERDSETGEGRTGKHNYEDVRRSGSFGPDPNANKLNK